MQTAFWRRPHTSLPSPPLAAYRAPSVLWQPAGAARSQAVRGVPRTLAGAGQASQDGVGWRLRGALGGRSRDG